MDAFSLPTEPQKACVRMGLDFRGKVMFGRDLRGVNLHGADIRLDCATFDGVKLDNIQVALYLLLLLQADIDEAWQAPLRDLIKTQLDERSFAVLTRYLQLG